MAEHYPLSLRHRTTKVDGKTIRAMTPVRLPTHRCVKCGSNAQGGEVERNIVHYVNPLIWLSALASGIITVFLYFGTRKPVEVEYYLCPKCVDSARIRRVTSSLVTLVGLAGWILGAPAYIALTAAVIAAIYRVVLEKRSPVRAIGHDDGEFQLSGASRVYLASIGRDFDRGESTGRELTRVRAPFDAQ